MDVKYSCNPMFMTVINVLLFYSGMSFMPTQLVGGTQLMGGFYQPMPGMFQTFATPIPYSTNLPSMTTNKTTGAMQDSTTPSSTMHLNPICNMKGPITSSTMVSLSHI